jgi:hypothetical protein
MSDQKPLGLVQLPTAAEVSAAVALAEAIIRLARYVYDWVTSENNDAPVSACVAALAVMIEREPEARARIVKACETNAVLRVQLLDICGAYEKTWPAFAKLRSELER